MCCHITHVHHVAHTLTYVQYYIVDVRPYNTGKTAKGISKSPN